MYNSFCVALVSIAVVCDVCAPTAPDPTSQAWPGHERTRQEEGEERLGSRVQRHPGTSPGPADQGEGPSSGRHLHSHMVHGFVDLVIAMIIISENVLQVCFIVIGVLILAVLALSASPVVRAIRRARNLTTSGREYELSPGDVDNASHSYRGLGASEQLSRQSERAGSMYEEIRTEPFIADFGYAEETDVDFPPPPPHPLTRGSRAGYLIPIFMND